MKNSLHFWILLLLQAALFPALAQQQTTPNAKLPTWYKQAVQTAAYPPGNSTDSMLIAITPQNKQLIRARINGEEYIKIVTWKGTNFYGDTTGKDTTTGPYDTWVTIAPELVNRMKLEKTTDKALRLKQMLGLPPVNTYNWFIEMWVRPQDLFRPCPDKEITDNKCNLCFNHQDSLDPAYINWINATRISRYYACGLYNQYPWTQLGYTYDWNPANKTHIGLCEFVIKPNSRVYVSRVYTTDAYLK